MAINHKVAIAIRIYPKVSKQPFIYHDNKFLLVRLGLLSLKKCLTNVSYKIFFILDGCNDEYTGLIENIFSSESFEICKTSAIGNAATFLKQIDILLNQTFSENIFLAEDDYLYVPGQFYRMLQLIEQNEKVHFVTPHAHLDYYKHQLHVAVNKKVEMLHNNYWHKASSTCLTFLTTKAILRQTKTVFETFKNNNYDYSIWIALTKTNMFGINMLGYNWRNIFYWKSIAKVMKFSCFRYLAGKKYNLYVAIPAVATHMQYDELGPYCNWNKIAEDILKNNPL